MSNSENDKTLWFIGGAVVSIAIIKVLGVLGWLCTCTVKILAEQPAC